MSIKRYIFSFHDNITLENMCSFCLSCSQIEYCLTPTSLLRQGINKIKWDTLGVSQSLYKKPQTKLHNT